MKINKGYIAIGLIIAFTLFFELAAHADVWDQATTITFSAPVQIPGQVLSAGTYVFRLANANPARNIVKFLKAARTRLYATLQTVAAERPNPTGHTAVTFAEQGTGR